MPVFAIYPADNLDPLRVWINEETEAKARHVVSLNVPSHTGARDSGIFHCRRDDSHSVPPGVIFIEGGKTVTVEIR